MHVEINGEVETMIQAGLASGEFNSVEEAVAFMAKCWREPSRQAVAAARSLSVRTLRL
jgi:hypothetical protein